MNVVITGGAGFLGSRLARELLALGKLTDGEGKPRDIAHVTLLDVVPARPLPDPRIEVRTGDIADPATIAAVVTPRTSSIFHLAAVVSGQAEAELDLGMRVNLDATRFLLEQARRNGNRPRVVFTSSVAVFGGALPARVADTTAVTPQSSYGTQKAMAELLLSDYSRRGLVDGRAVRMPTICVRPGAPNKAASSFASGIIREPLNGVEAVCPVAPGTVMWLMSPRKAIRNLVRAHELDAGALGTERALSMPGLSVTVEEMVRSLERVAGVEVVRRIRWQEDPALGRIVRSWPGDFNAARARSLGFEADAGFDEIVRAYVEEELKR
jgi:nucleoside-diphosphate-sugar epimerase